MGMKKAALVTIFDVPNYGSVLQAFATLKIIESLGYDVTTINYTRKNSWVRTKSSSHKVNFIKWLLNRLKITTYGRLVGKLNNFRCSFLKLSKKYNSLEDLYEENWRNVDLFVTGSDQVWNTKYLYGDSVFLLSFVPEDKKRISFASSFALNSLSPQFHDKYKKYLDKFSSISVRENNGVKIIRDQLNLETEIKVLLDPTLLLSKSDWTRISGIKNKSERYILFYMLDYAFDPKPYIFEVAKFFKDKMDCKVLALAGYKRSSKANGLKTHNIGDSSVLEFVRLFANADLVITSSFHGTAFALNFGIPLISIIPNSGDDRQVSLLESLGVGQCAIRKNAQIDKIDPFYDVELEQKKLAVLRLDSLKWIEKNIN